MRMEYSYGPPLELKGLKTVYYGMILGLTRAVFSRSALVVIALNVASFVFLLYGLFQLCKTDEGFRHTWTWGWMCATFMLADIGVYLYFSFTTYTYPWYLQLAILLLSMLLYLLFIRSLLKNIALLSRQVGMPQVEETVWSRWRLYWMMTLLAMAGYTVMYLLVRFAGLQNIQTLYTILLLVTLVAAVWVIALVNVCFMTMNGQRRILADPTVYSIEDAPDDKRRSK